jgi:hypothetical protein
MGGFRRPESSAITSQRFVSYFVQRHGRTPKELADHAAAIARLRGQKRARLLQRLAKKSKRVRDTEMFREIVLEHIGRYPSPFGSLQRSIEDDYGTHCVRRLYRALAHFIKKGLIVRTDEGYRLISKRGQTGGASC